MSTLSAESPLTHFLHTGHCRRKLVGMVESIVDFHGGVKPGFRPGFSYKATQLAVPLEPRHRPSQSPGAYATYALEPSVQRVPSSNP